MGEEMMRCDGCGKYTNPSNLKANTLLGDGVSEPDEEYLCDTCTRAIYTSAPQKCADCSAVVKDPEVDLYGSDGEDGGICSDCR